MRSKWAAILAFAVLSAAVVNAKDDNEEKRPEVPPSGGPNLGGFVQAAAWSKGGDPEISRIRSGIRIFRHLFVSNSTNSL